jgi:hypothetical protein
MIARRNPQRPRNAYAEDMIRKEKETAHRPQRIRDERDVGRSRWLPSLFVTSLAIAFFVIAYAMS